MNELYAKGASYFEVYYEMFSDKKTRVLNANGIILYSMMANQVGLSKRPENAKKYTNKNGEVFIIFTELQAKQKLNISKATFFKLKKQLKDIGLIDYKDQVEKKNGVSTPIYVTPYELWKKKQNKVEITFDFPDF